MEKVTLLIGSLLLVFFTAAAQSGKPGFSIEVSGGPTFPIGSFGSKDTARFAPSQSGEQAGWAKTGAAINVIASYQFKHHLGVVLEVSGQRNKRNEDPYRKLVKNSYEPHDVRIEAEAGAWKIGKVLAGGFFMLPISEKTFWSFRALAGVCKTAIPRRRYDAYTKNNSNTSMDLPFESALYDEITLPWTFCYQLSSGLKYFLSQKIFLTATSSYFNTQIMHEKYYYHNLTNPSWSGIRVDKQYRLTSLYLTAGIGWAFQ